MANEGTETKKRTRTNLTELLHAVEKMQRDLDAVQTQQNAYRPLGEKITKDNPDSKIVRADRPAPGGAYIVQMPTEWSGLRMGISFKRGVGIIDVEREDADELAHWMEADYHYQIMPATESETNKMRKLLDGIKPVEKPQTAAEKMLNPRRI